MRGAWRAARATRATNGSMIGSIIREWKACEVCSRRVWTPRAASVSASAATASAGPATTQDCGPLTAARARSGPSSGSSSASRSGAASIAPGGRLCIRRPRSAISASASSSAKTPASVAATYSPTLWPASATGLTPQLIQSCASAYSTAKSAGWASQVCSSERTENPEPRTSSGMLVPGSWFLVLGSSGYSTSRRSSPRCGVSRSQQRSSQRRNTGSPA